MPLLTELQAQELPPTASLVRELLGMGSLALVRRLVASLVLEPRPTESQGRDIVP